MPDHGPTPNWTKNPEATPAIEDIETARAVLVWVEAQATKPTAALAVWTRSVREWLEAWQPS